MPESLAGYIDRFSAFMAAPSQQVCISSYGDRMVFGEVSPYATHDVMMHFCRRLVTLGVDVELSSNDHNAQGEDRRHARAGEKGETEKTRAESRQARRNAKKAAKNKRKKERKHS